MDGQLDISVLFCVLGMDAVCTDLVTGKEVDGGHCASTAGSGSCQLTCPSSQDPDSSSSSSTEDGDSLFCHGGGYDMYMGGFVSALVSGGDCLLLFFAGWKLDSRLKFAAACICIFGLGVLIEFCTNLRRNLFKKVILLHLLSFDALPTNIY